MSNQDSTNHFPTSGAGTWVFDKEVTDCFDDMLDKSVPCYSHALGVFLRYIATQMNLSSTVKVLDLGVSTAAYFRAMKARFPEVDFHFTGVDCSAPMIEKAKEMYPDAEYALSTVEDFMSKTEGRDWDVVILSLTLQFLPIEHRQEVLSRVFKGLNSGGIVFLFEKCLGEDSFEESLYTKIYYSVKHDMGYSWDSIMTKRKSLENVLVPLTSDFNRKMLEREGFRVVPVVQWCNFSAFIAIKE